MNKAKNSNQKRDKSTAGVNIAYAEQAEIRSKVYMLLSTFYMVRPDREFVNKIFHKDFINNLKAINLRGSSEIEGIQDIVDFLDHHGDLSSKEIIELLAVDFTRLFRGIKKGYGPPPPYESVWRGEERIMGESTMNVLSFYHDSGLGMDLKGEVPDYIGIELKFMSLLCYHEKVLWEKEDYLEAVKTVEKEQNFLLSFLSQWVPAYCDRMVSEARTGIYRGIGKVTTQFINYDMNLVRDSIVHLKELYEL